ncbi:hydrolase, partial [Chloroflexota bacterium]
MTKHNIDTQCCPKFDPDPWCDKEIIWKDKLFVKDTMMQFMHTPLPGVFGKKVGRMWKKIEDAEANPNIKDFIMLATESSPWKGEVYINATKEVPNAENVKLSGTYITKVFDGPYNAV